MTARPISTIPPAATAVGHTAHRPLRAAAAITGVAALIAAGGYLATTTIGPDSIPTAAPTGAAVNPSAQALSELRESVAGQYGSQSAAGAAVNPSARALRDRHRSIAGQYATRPTAGAVVNPSAHALSELRASVAGQYATRPATGAVVNPSAHVLREMHQSIARQYGAAR